MALYQTIFAGDTTKTGLTPTWSMLKKKSDLTAYTPQPAIREVGLGVYDFDYSAITEAVTGMVDLGATVASADRFVPVDLYPATDGKIVIADEPAGQYSIIFSLIDADLNAVSNADVRIYVGNTTTPVYTRQSNTAGLCKFVMLDALEYHVTCSKVGFVFDEFIFTPSASATVEIEGTGVVYPAAPAGFQNVIGGTVHGSNEAAEHAVVIATPVFGQELGDYGVTLRQVRTESAIDGTWVLALRQGVQYRVVESFASKANREKLITVTNDAVRGFGDY